MGYQYKQKLFGKFPNSPFLLRNPKFISDGLLLSRARFLFNFATKLQNIFGKITNYFWHHYLSKKVKIT